MDVLIIENILGDLTVDTVSIVNSLSTCDISHDRFEIGDELILRVDENRIDNFSGHPFISPGFCSSQFLTLNSDGIVEGGLRADLKSQPFDEFKSEIGLCSELTAIDRWISQIDERVRVFPNPSSEAIFLEFFFYTEEEGSYEIYDAVGQLTQKGIINFNNIFPIVIKDHPRGIYFLKIKIRDQLVIRKIVKD